MKKLICDLCGKEITEVDVDHARLVIATSKFGRPESKDLHIACAVRLNNKINSFIAEEQKKEKNIDGFPW